MRYIPGWGKKKEKEQKEDTTANLDRGLQLVCSLQFTSLAKIGIKIFIKPLSTEEIPFRFMIF